MTITLDGKEVLFVSPTLMAVVAGAIVAGRIVGWAWLAFRARKARRVGEMTSAMEEFLAVLQTMPKRAPRIPERSDDVARMDRDRGLV